MTVGVRTDAGCIRELNEDAFFIGEDLYAVADGMGGHDAGEVASFIAVDTLREFSSTAGAIGEGNDPRDPLAEVIRRINGKIYLRSQLDQACAGMGTTFTVALLVRNRVYLAHVGDSRAYLVRGNRITQITDDHSVVGELLRKGGITAEEAHYHPQRNVITRALGTFPHVEADFHNVPLRRGDILLLCTDGLTNAVMDEEIRHILCSAADPQLAADALVDLAIERGGHDNITALVVTVDRGTSPRSLPERTACESFSYESRGK